MKQPLVIEGKAVDAGGENGVHRRRDLETLDRSAEVIRSAFSHQRFGLDERPNALFEEERVPLGGVDQESRQPTELGVADQRVKQFLRAPARQRVDPDLAIVRLAAPAVTVFGTVTDEQQYRSGRQAFDHALEDCLRLAVDPVEILHDENQRLGEALAKEQESYGFQCAAATRGRFQAVKAILFG